jgi:uncharacterized protein
VGEGAESAAADDVAGADDVAAADATGAARALPAAERRRLQELLAHLLEFHRREEKPMWWALFERQAATTQELIEDLDCLGGLERTADPPLPIARSLGFRYRFDPEQSSKLGPGSKVICAHDLGLRGTLEELDADAGTLLLKISRRALAGAGAGEELPSRLALIPDEHVSAEVLDAAIGDVATAWMERGELPPPLLDLLLRRPPRIAGHRGGALLDRTEEVSAGAVRLVRAMRDTTLCIQGPPGAGKTYTGARVIAALLEEGAGVGITANSHKAILNLMVACDERLGGGLECLKVGGERDDPFFTACPGAQWIRSSNAAAALFGGGLIGGTAWLFSRPEWRGRLDYLFVDEAGQLSLAKLAAIAPAARNLVLLGDQMQLGQPARGTHPGESGLSVLDYLLRDHATIPPELGIFLPTTWRLHPLICRFISAAVYEGRLHPEPHTAARVILPSPRSRPLVTATAGVLFLPCEHSGNTQGSVEEAELIARLTAELLEREYTDAESRSLGRLPLSEILYVAPYNMQVRMLRRLLPEGARVGSVDRFQGQEAAVVVISLCSSAGEVGGRGLEFLLDKNRLNVAISRARALVLVVGDPRLAQAPCHRIEDMARLSFLSRILEIGQGSHSTSSGEPTIPGCM